MYEFGPKVKGVSEKWRHAGFGLPGATVALSRQVPAGLSEQHGPNSVRLLSVELAATELAACHRRAEDSELTAVRAPEILAVVKVGLA